MKWTKPIRRALVILASLCVVVAPTAARADGTAFHASEEAGFLSAPTLPLGLRLDYSAKTSFTDSCSGSGNPVAPGDCSPPLWANNPLLGDPISVKYSWHGTGNLASAVPLNVAGRGSARLTETNIKISGTGTVAATNPLCSVTVSDGVVSTGATTPGTLQVLSLLPKADSNGDVTDFTLTMNIPAATVSGYSGQAPIEWENWSWHQTADPPDPHPYPNDPCVSGSFPAHEPDSNATNEVEGLAIHDNNVNALDNIVLTGWKMTPGFNADRGGTWASKTISQSFPYGWLANGSDQGSIVISETLKIVSGPCASPFELSGPSWTTKFSDSDRVQDLGGSFREDVTRFIDAMRSAGIDVHVIDTRRPAQRAYLMHYSWLIAKDKQSPANVPKFVPASGQEPVDICWDHRDAAGNLLEAESVGAAQQMVAQYRINPQLQVAPALNSLHTQGLAIDMNTTWPSGKTVKIRDADGGLITIGSGPHNGLNRTLIQVGATYGVIHFLNAAKDPNHWSVNGH